MSLKIIRKSQPIEVKQIAITIYSLPGIGKTSLASSAGKVLLLDTDNGSYRSGNRGDVVRPECWEDIASISADDLAPYDAVALDTAGRALDMLTAHLIDKNPKMVRSSGELTIQGYGALKTAFVTWMRRVRSYGKDVILLSHMDEKQEGDITKERLDIQGGSKTEIYKSSDAICKLYVDGKQRKLDFSPREGSLGKNPAQFDILTVPSFAAEPQYFAGVIADIKAALNKLGESQRQVAEENSGFLAVVNNCTTLADLNGALVMLKGKPPSAQVEMLTTLTARAKELGFHWERGAKSFTGNESESLSSSTGAGGSSTPEAPKATPPATASPKKQTAPTKAADAKEGHSWLVTDPQRKRLFALAKECGFDDSQLRNLAGKSGVEHLHEMTPKQYKEITEEMELYIRGGEAGT